MNDEIFTFSSKPNPNNNNHFQIYTVKKEFLNVCLNPSDHTEVDLLGELNLPKYLHNTIGPAIIDPSNSVEEYREQFWLNGRKLTNRGVKKLFKLNEIKFVKN